MSINNSLAGTAVHDLTAAKVWYERLLGRAPDQEPMAEVVEWKFPNGGWIQVFADPERAGKSSLTLSVSDLDEEWHRIRESGFEVGEINDAKSVRTAIMTDPDGNQIVLAQPLIEAIAQ